VYRRSPSKVPNSPSFITVAVPVPLAVVSCIGFALRAVIENVTALSLPTVPVNDMPRTSSSATD
jgi:hypothetical protein